MNDLNDRPPIPVDLKRQVLIEAGHRCAIPTCRFPTTEIAHIEPWSKVKEHKFKNLIALCPNCHTRFDNHEIDKKSILIYKKRLQFLSDRYTRFELDVMFELVSKTRVVIPTTLFVKRLFDETLIKIELEMMIQEFDDGDSESCFFSVILTDNGKEFIQKWTSLDEVMIY